MKMSKQMRSYSATALTLAAFALSLLAATANGQITQDEGASYVAFEAETAVLIAGTPENWTVTNDSAASGGSALVADGTTSTADSPHSFAQMRINFKTTGTYYLYYRWRADAARTATDNGAANSAWVGNRFGAFSAPGNQADYIRTDSNNYSAPGNNTFQWLREVLTLTYVIGAAETSTTQTLTFGTREAGMIIDRLVLSTNSNLTAAALDALANSGAVGSPVFSPASGRYPSSPLNVTITSDPGSTIFYTTDGSVPTASSASGSSPFNVNVSTTLTLRAFASKAGYQNSPVSSAAYDIAASPTSYSMVVSNDAPILYWNFDEAFGQAEEIMPVVLPTTLNDLAPFNTATRVSHADLGSGLKLGNAASLTEGDYFYASNLSVGTNSLSAPWAIEFWMQAQDSLEFVRFDYLMGFGTGGNHPGILYDYDGGARYTLEAFGGGRSDGTNGPAIADMNWHHVVIVYYGNGDSGVADRLSMYVDGGLAAPDVRNTFTSPISLTQLTVGTSTPQFPVDGFWGSLDELAVYDLASKTNESQVTAKAAQIASHYALASSSSSAELYSQGVLADSPLLYWNFNETDGNAHQLVPVSAQLAKNNLTPANGATRTSHASMESGLDLGNAADFSTYGEHFAIGTLSFPQATLPPPYLIEFWMRVKGSATTHPRYDYLANFANNAPAILYDYNGENPNGGLELFQGGNRTGFGPSIEDNNWRYVLFAYYGDGATGVADRLDIYVDGTNAAQNVRASYGSSLSLNAGLVLGTSGGSFAVADGFEGNLDEFAIYDLSALTTENEVTSRATDIAARHFAAAPSVLLQTFRSGNNLVISWPGTATGFALEIAPVVNGSWSAAGVTPELVNGRWQATITIGPDIRFFRLHK
jgi:hypothetical protein